MTAQTMARVTPFDHVAKPSTRRLRMKSDTTLAAAVPVAHSNLRQRGTGLRRMPNTPERYWSRSLMGPLG
jgi:hypothetical protein